VNRSVQTASSFALPLALLATSACGDGDTGAGGGGDGRYRPAKNGVPVAEATSCSELSSALESARTRLSCTMTTPTCPSLVRTKVGGEACLQYDEGTIDGCAEHYRESGDCDELKSRFDDCVIAAIVGSAPAGCD
jgi:hypothetical protein